MKRLDRRFAMACGLAALSAGCAAPDTRPPREALIRKATAAEIAFAKTMVDGDHAVFLGPVAAPGGKVVSRFCSTWRLEPDGRWRVVFDDGYDVCDCPGT